MTTVGWSDALITEAYGLRHELRTTSKTARAPVGLRRAVASDIASREEFQSAGLVRIRAFLEPTNPDQTAFLFHDFAAGKGAAAVLNVMRVEELIDAEHYARGVELLERVVAMLNKLIDP